MGDCTLNDLTESTDGGDPNNSPPPHSMATILAYAIRGSPKGRLTFLDIKIAIKRRFRFFAKTEHDIGMRVGRIILVYFPSQAHLHVSLLSLQGILRRSPTIWT